MRKLFRERCYRLAVWGAVSFLVAFIVFVCARRDPSREQRSIASKRLVRGSILDENRVPIAGARVRLNHGPIVTQTDTRGAFALPDPEIRPFSLTAWKARYLIGGMSFSEQPAIMKLRRLPDEDNAGYIWVDPRPDSAKEERCGNCHTEIFDEWWASGHADSARNRRFLSLVEGTDWHGRSQVGWSLRDEHPLGVGVCAACHAPGIDFDAGASDDIRDVTGVASLGVHCDFCHKIRDVVTNDFGLVHGRFGFQLLRPHKGQLFFGTLDDVDRGEDTYSPLQHESRYCASCHEGVVFGVHVYSTYSEWLASPAKRQGQSCQSCHMAPTGRMSNIAPGAGGIERDPATLGSHTLLPGGRKAMLQKCLQLDIALEMQTNAVGCCITLTARNVGHQVPTGFIDRHLILVVEPLDAARRLLPLQSGPTLPSEVGDQLSALPGRWFGRLLTDDSRRSPIPFWHPARTTTDSRLKPEQPVATTFSFPAETHQVRTRVLYRRFWKSIADDKLWPDDTITVYDERRTTSNPDRG